MAERRVAKHDVVIMLKHACAMDLGRWIADLLDIDFMPDQDFGPNQDDNVPEHRCPDIAEYGECHGVLYGPFVHGKTFPMEDLAQCVDCYTMHNRCRLLCAHCRDDIDVLVQDFRRCLAGYCPAKG